MSKRDAKIFDKTFFNNLGKKVRDKYIAHTFDPKGKGSDAKDIDDKPFKQYSREYAEAKKSGVLKDIDGTPQSTKFKDSRAPVLTGSLLRSFNEMNIFSNGFGFGSITRKGRVKKLDNMGRTIYRNDKPLPTHIVKYIMSELTEDVNGAFKKIRKNMKKKKINIHIGK